MCFSANGSFALAAVLTAVGTATVARNTQPELRMLAAVPLLFAAQQATEGVVWLTFGRADQDMLHRFAVMAFLSVAMVVWPTWVAAALRRAEPAENRRYVLGLFLALGGTVSVVAALLLARLHPVAVIAGHSISYDFVHTTNEVVSLLLLVVYILPTVGPFFVSTLPLARTIGMTLATSLAITFVLRRETLTSVWCFFAALMSMQLLFALERRRAGLENWRQTRAA
jgi:hypothetical protein